MITDGKTGVNKKGKIDVFINDQTNPLFQYFLINEQKTDITLTSDIVKDDQVINVSSGHGFTAAVGEYITIFQANRWLQMRVVSVLLNAITVSHPVDFAYTVSGATVIRGNNILKVNGLVTPLDFKMQLRNFTIPIDIGKIVLTMTHSTAGDDGKFGGIAALTKGIWFRKENGIDFNMGNYLSNQDFRNMGADVTYTSKGPAGIESTAIVLDLVKIFGQVIRFDNRLNDVFFSQVRDNLTTLSSFVISVVGSYTDED